MVCNPETYDKNIQIFSCSAGSISPDPNKHFSVRLIEEIDEMITANTKQRIRSSL